MRPQVCNRAHMGTHTTDLAIIGAGPAGLYAAYYAGFRGWSVAVIDALPEIGGQVNAMYPEKAIFDVAGFPSVLGRDLISNLSEQAGKFSPSYLLNRQANALTHNDDSVTIGCDDGTEVTAKAAIITGGIGAFHPRPLPAGNEWLGKGLVHFVPTLSDHAGKDVLIVGGGDSAFDWALSLLPIARSVRLVHRREQFRAHQATVDEVKAKGVELLTPYEVSAITDAQGGTSGPLAKVHIKSKSGDEQVLNVDSVIAALGFVADISALNSWGLTMTSRRIAVDSAMRTGVDRVLAAGDIADYEGKVPLIAVGFGEAALAVNNAATWVEPGASVFPGHSSGGSAD